jgi:hypothetical protein
MVFFKNFVGMHVMKMGEALEHTGVGNSPEQLVGWQNV